MAHVLPAAAIGPTERLARLFDAHYDRLYRLACRLAVDAAHAEDLVQETFLRAARSLPSIPAGAEEAWVVRVLVNIRRDEWRKEQVRKRTHPEPAPPSHAHDAAVVARTTVWRALDCLPPRRRAVVVMHELEELPIARVASQLGISVITARWHLSKGRRDLERILRGGEHR